MRIEPLRDIGGRLLDVEKPARYLGGELGAVRKEGEGLYTVALCFPDLYEIGMSNNAIRILYDGLNRIERLRCERVFAPAPDFEALLGELGLPLYTLESGIALCDADMLGLSVGYELAATSILSVLASGRIPLRAAERGEGDPVVIAGGPAIANPHPYSDFLDAAYIGEAEASFFALAARLAGAKASGARREDILALLAEDPAVWIPARGGRGGRGARRAVYAGFSGAGRPIEAPVPTLRSVQDHGTVEVMRGCPNGCRFCHAGYYYRPRRIKSFPAIRAEVDYLVRGRGYREITLSSLSSGDYPRLPELLDSLNARWSRDRVSFQLPSLKVNSFTLPLLSRIAEVRKSGLTFAVETPVDQWQRLINKDVSFERTVAILKEAQAQGFKQAKFYFMVGLPVPGRGQGEVEAILEYFDRLFASVRMQINVNVGTFVPKPHTPFQWSRQLTEAESLDAIQAIRSGLRAHKSVKLSYHSPFVSQLEGVIARGDERVGGLVLDAFQRGARLDAWEDRFDRELWRSVLDEAAFHPVEELCRERALQEMLPWSDINVGVASGAMKRELERALDMEFSDACAEKCSHPCGVCSKGLDVVEKNAQPEPLEPAPEAAAHAKSPSQRLVFTFCKTGAAAYYPHLSVLEAFDRAFLMKNLPIAYSEGFNPAPRLETVQPLPIAVSSEAEVASLLLTSDIEPVEFVEAMNESLPDGLLIGEARRYPVTPGIKQRSIGSMIWGSVFRLSGFDTAFPVRFRATLEALGLGESITSESEGILEIALPEPKSKERGLTRILEASIDARPPQRELSVRRIRCLADAGDGPVSFFEAYEKLCGIER